MNLFNWAGLVAAVLWLGGAEAGTFFGAGAAFPKPVYLAWGHAYKAESDGILIFTVVGSGKGQNEIKSARTDFGASDMPLTMEELSKEGLVQFPTVIGGVVPVANVKGVADGQLRLDGDTLAAIFLGKITRWNDAAIVALNPGVSLPNEAINVLHRTDKSGATFYFTNYLSKVSNAWKTTQGEGLTVAWNGGVGVDSSENMAQKIATTPNAIGYLDFVILKKKSLAAVTMKNAEGMFVAANNASFSAAASAAKWNPANGFREILTNQPGKESWPVTSATFVLVERTPSVTENVVDTLKFFDWAYRKGDQIALDLNYVPLPDSVADLVRNTWKTQIKNHAGVPVWK